MDEHKAAHAGLISAAARTDGVFSLGRARELGVTDRMLQGLLRRGQIRRVHVGVYAFTVAPWSWEGALRAAVEAVGRRRVHGVAGCASHAAAARLLDVGGVACGLPEVCVPWPWMPRLSGVRVHSSRDLSEEDITSVRGIRTTTGSRTTIDLAARLGRFERMAVVDEWSMR